MVRVKLPFGGINPEQLDAFAERRRALRAAAQGPHHDAPERPAAPRPADRCGQADPRDLAHRALLARGLRQHDPQRHRRPVGRGLRERALRPDALRRRLRALLRAQRGLPADAAQVQDGVQRDRRGRRDHRDPRRRLHPADPRRSPRLRDSHRRRHVDHAARRARRSTSSSAPTTAST